MMEHLKKNKRIYGAIFAGIAGGLSAYGWTEAATAVGMIGAFLLGAGAVKSDAEVQAGR